jgi:hypothetical protein
VDGFRSSVSDAAARNAGLGTRPRVPLAAGSPQIGCRLVPNVGVTRSSSCPRACAQNVSIDLDRPPAPCRR